MTGAPAFPDRRGFTLIEVIGALVVFSLGVLMVLGLTGSLSRQLRIASLTSVAAVAMQNSLDSLQAVPYESLVLGSSTDTVMLQGRAYLRTRAVLQTTPVVREIQVTLEPLGDGGTEMTASAFVVRSW